MSILTTCDMCSQLIQAANFSETLCYDCQQIADEVASQTAEAEQAEEDAGAHADWEASQAAEAEADAWHSQWD